MIPVTFACGHTASLSGTEQDPCCWCGERRIVKVTARAPRFKGHAMGPCATFKPLKPRAVTLADRR